MKTKVLITICILFFSSIALFAQENNIVKTVSVDDNNHTKEYIVYDKNNKNPLYRTVYEYNEDNNRVKRNSYIFKKGQWVDSKKYEYTYNSDKRPLYIVFTKWNDKVKDWENTSELILHSYDKNGDFLSVTKIQIDSKYKFISKR
ncbi:MAG: hypothetical protein LBU84_10795 [Prevotella sp.]|jgi:hypothetical protein|nr:hypothetical protein [Prevotella sp.]